MSWMARFGAGWLIAMSAILSIVAGYAFTSSRWACGASGSSFACDLSNIGVVILLALAALHLVAGVAGWRGGLVGLVFGATVASVGTTVSLLLAATEPWLVAAPFIATYLTAAVALWRQVFAGRHRGRPSWSGMRRISMPSGRDPAGDIMPPHP